MAVSFVYSFQLLAHRGHGLSSSTQRRRGEVHAEALAPDRHCMVLRQINVQCELVVLVTNVALESPDFDKADLLYGLAVARVIGCNQVNVHVGSIRGFEVSEAKDALTPGELIDARLAYALMSHLVEVPGQENLG